MDTPAPMIFGLGARLSFFLVLFAPLGFFQTLLSKVRVKHDNKLVETLCVVLDSYIQVRSHPGMIQKIALWTTVTTAMSVLTIMSLYYMLGFDVSVLQAVFITAIGSWGLIFSITPATIGIREGLMVFAAQVFDLPVAETLSVAKPEDRRVGKGC